MTAEFAPFRPAFRIGVYSGTLVEALLVRRKARRRPLRNNRIFAGNAGILSA